MTRKDYKNIARRLRDMQEVLTDAPAVAAGTRLGFTLAITQVAAALAEDNANFDRDRFLEACRFNPGWLTGPEREVVG